MRDRLLILPVLVACGPWACGGMRWLHEELGHDASSADAPIRVFASATRVPPTIAAAARSHHDCPICQMLAAMSATRTGEPPSAAAPQDPVPQAKAFLDVVIGSSPVAWLRPPRGPPMA